jgi:hypothetical protein
MAAESIGSPGLDALMSRALSGENQAISIFLTEFLQATIFVPKRFQSHPLSDAPAYPDPFLNILGVQSGERVLVPAFTRREYIAEWSNLPLDHRSFTGKELLNTLPEDWWLILNPGREVEKELTPWEINELKRGIEAVPLVAQDLTETEFIESLEICPVPADEYPELRGALINEALTDEAITQMFLLSEKGTTLEGEARAIILLGVEIDTTDARKIQAAKDTLQALADRVQIGSDRVRLYVGKSQDQSVLLDAFRHAQPFYKRPEKGQFCYYWALLALLVAALFSFAFWAR